MDRKKLTIRAIMEAEKLRIIAKVSAMQSVDPVDIAEDICNCRVRFAPLSSLDGIYSSIPSPNIILGSKRPYGRRNYTCAHELGHHIFGHGERIDEIGKQYHNKEEELLADIFAGYFLMPKTAVIKAFSVRNYTIDILSVEQIYKISCYFGVGYSTIITHMHYSLNIISEHKMKEFLKTKPKDIKNYYAVSPDVMLLIADNFWIGRAITMEVGDVLLLPFGYEIESSNHMHLIGKMNGYLKFEACASGYTRAFDRFGDRAAHIRISRKNYEGLSRYRFLEEVQE